MAPMKSWLKMALPALLVAACHSSGGSSSSSPPPIASAACQDATAPVTITDPTNYALSDSFSIKTYTLKDNTDLTFDWSALTTDFFGKAMNPAADVDLIVVAHFKTADLQQLQSKFLDLQSLADEWYTTSSIAGSSVDLSTLVDANGAAFPGIDDTGIWMNALFCDNCNNPAPWSITILQPCM